MFRNEHGVPHQQSFEDILLSDSLSDFNPAPMTTIGTDFDLDLDQLTNTSLDIPDSDWDVVAQSDNILDPMFGSNAKPNNLSFLQLSPPAMQFETLPDTKFATTASDPVPVQQPARSSPFFQQSNFHQQQISAIPLQSAMYMPESQTGVVRAKLISSDYGQMKVPSHYEVASASTATAAKTGLPSSSSNIAHHDKEQQDHIVNSLSVSQMLAVASAYEHVCQVEDLDIGCANWLASTPEASEVDVRAVRALFNPDRWNFAKDIVIRVVKIVDSLRSTVSVSAPQKRKNIHKVPQTRNF